MFRIFSNRKFLKVFFFVIASWLTIHFVLTVIYSVRSVNVPSLAKEISDDYAIPLFHQNWKLFAPDVPEYNVELQYRICRSGTWTGFVDASGGNGHGPHSTIETIEQSVCTGLGWQVAHNLYSTDLEKKFDRIVASGDYQRALHLVYVLDMNRSESLPDSLQMKLNFRFTPAPDGAFNYQFSELEFPVETGRYQP